MRRKFYCLLMMMATLLCACAANPTQEVVTSKNDGSFDANVVQSATENNDPDVTQAVNYNEVFASTDGSVEFTMNVSEDFGISTVPVVEVEPHYLTGDDVHRVAIALLGDADFYEQGPVLYEEFTKTEIQRKLGLMTPYTNVEKMKELYNAEIYGEDVLEVDVEIVRAFVEKLTTDYETAPAENPYGLCQWTFMNGAYYLYSEESIASGETRLSDYNEEIKARTQVNGVPYLISASKRNQDDFKLNNIFIRIDSGSGPSTLEEDIFMAQLCATEPTQDQLDAIKKQAQQILESIDLGEWYIDECYVETSADGRMVQNQYIIHVDAVPVINGVPAIRRAQIGNLKSSETYASNYYLTDANFEFSANGDLIYFSMYSTIDVKKIINDNVATLSMDELLEKAKAHLTLSDRSNYGIPEDLLVDWDSYYGEPIICKVNICELEYGMTRVKVPNSDDSYYYVPAIILSGTRSYYGKNSDTLYYTVINEAYTDGISPLVAINAVDGSIIQLNNE